MQRAARVNFKIKSHRLYMGINALQSFILKLALGEAIIVASG